MNSLEEFAQGRVDGYAAYKSGAKYVDVVPRFVSQSYDAGWHSGWSRAAHEVCSCGHTPDQHGKYFKQRPCNECACPEIIAGRYAPWPPRTA